MLPGDTYTVNDLLRVVLRRKWVIIVPAVMCAAAAFVVALALADRYRSETVIMVVPQRVPEAYVRSIIATDVPARIRQNAAVQTAYLGSAHA